MVDFYNTISLRFKATTTQRASFASLCFIPGTSGDVSACGFVTSGPYTVHMLPHSNTIEDAESRASLNGAGIGTPATRASIIETLFSRDYVRRDKKNLVPTEKGLAVYNIVKDKRIADVEMTGQWETALARIESGEMDAVTFRKGIEVYTAQITEELLQVRLSVASGEEIPCPKCQSGRILFYPKVAKCSNVDCSLTVFRSKGEKLLSDKQITELATKGKASLIKGFKSKEGKPFDAHVTFDKDFRTVYEFPPKTGGKGGRK